MAEDNGPIWARCPWRFFRMPSEEVSGGEGNRVVRIMNFSRDILYWNLLSL